jgi:hypothetical protein
MVDFSAITGTIAALKGVTDIAKAIKDLHPSGALDAKIRELNSRILEAQSSAFAANDERSALIERIRALEAEVAGLKAWDAEKQNYQLKEVYAGSFAYVLKPIGGGVEPIHWLCPACYQQGKKSLLQYNGRSASESRSSIYGCPRCKNAIRVDYRVTPTGDPWQRPDGGHAP